MLFEKIQLEDDEKILSLVRRHWFVLFVEIFGVLVIALLPFFSFYIVTRLIDLSETEIFSYIDIYRAELIFISALWFLMHWMTMATIWTDYYLDLWPVTNKRIISIEQKGLFRREIGSFRLERLQDMQVEIDGIIQTFLDFGTVEAETASGSSDEFRARNLPKPRELKALILKATDKRMNITSNINSI